MSTRADNNTQCCWQSVQQHVAFDELKYSRLLCCVLSVILSLDYGSRWSSHFHIRIFTCNLSPCFTFVYIIPCWYALCSVLSSIPKSFSSFSLFFLAVHMMFLFFGRQLFSFHFLFSSQLQETADAILEEAGRYCKQVLEAMSQRREKLVELPQKEAPSSQDSNIVCLYSFVLFYSYVQHIQKI